MRARVCVCVYVCVHARSSAHGCSMSHMCQCTSVHAQQRNKRAGTATEQPQLAHQPLKPPTLKHQGLKGTRQARAARPKRQVPRPKRPAQSAALGSQPQVLPRCQALSATHPSSTKLFRLLAVGRIALDPRSKAHCHKVITIF